MKKLYSITCNGLLALALGMLGTAALAKEAKKGGKGSREKYINREATLKGKDSKSINFDDVDIGGERKTPMGTLINQNKADKNYDFVKIREGWHPEMMQSASSLDAGAK